MDYIYLEMKDLYWCDRCYKDIVDENDIVKRIYFSCYSNQQWANHLNTKKHIKCCLKVEEDSEKVCCKYCNKNFTKEGYEVHKKRNDKLWEGQKNGGFKNIKCNNFFTKNKRYENFNDYCSGTDPNKPKVRRTAVGKISPITNIVRAKNKNNKNYIKVEEEDYDKDLEYCNKCNKVLINDSNYTDLQIQEKFNLDMCNCVEEVVQPTENKIINPTKNIPLVVERRSDGLTLTIEEIDTTEKPIFIDHCYDCNKGIMDLAISKRIYDLWEMDYCDCDDSDSDYD
tara:strand:+ start:172 stop:1020 length:849 start_codon:yes stop_codon:yes gene_type:complete